MSFARWVSYLASAAFCTAACRSGPDVQVLGESTRLRRGEASPGESALFDGSRVKLKAARGETLGLELRIGDRRTRHVGLELPAEAAQVSGFAVRFVRVSEPSSEMYGPSRGAGEYPEVLVPRTGPIAADDLVYFDVAVASDAPPGRHQGLLRVEQQSIRVELEVSRARIDLRRDPLVWVFYLPSDIARVEGLPDGDQPELIEREARYHELFRAHGAFLAADLGPERFEARRRFVHDVKYWPVAVDTTSDESIARDVHVWLETFRGSGVTPFAIPVDEPHTPSEKQRARRIADAIGRAGGGAPNFLRGVTDAREPIYGDSLDVFLSPLGFPVPARERAGSVRFWTYNGRPPSAGSMIIDTDGVALRTWGWIAERYGVELWYAWQGLYFSDRYNHGGPTDVFVDPITFDERSRGGTDWGNGDGLLAYPGALASLRLKELRRGLEDRLLLRELAVCDPEAARGITARMVPRALGEARGARSWSIEEAPWERARLALLDAIERSCP